MGKKIEELIPEKQEEWDPDKCEFKTMADYDRWNAWARKNGRPVKVPTEDFYPKVKVRFQRFEQPENILKVRVRNREIDWTGQLKPGKTYNLCQPVVTFLNNLATPIFEEVKVTDDGVTKTETKQTGERPRFSCQVLEFSAA